jgi:multidrug efflux pump
MSAIAFCAGVIPLIGGSGAGSGLRRSMGIAGFSGMLGVTLFGIFLTPVFYVLLRSRRARRVESGGMRDDAGRGGGGTVGALRPQPQQRHGGDGHV